MSDTLIILITLHMIAALLTTGYSLQAENECREVTTEKIFIVLIICLVVWPTVAGCYLRAYIITKLPGLKGKRAEQEKATTP